MSKLLKVENLEVVFKVKGGEVQAVRDLSFSVNRGEIAAIVGESGSGKSVTVKSILGLLPKKSSEVKNGKIYFEDKDLLTLNKKQMQSIKGSEISMVFQDPMSSLNPTMKIGKQIEESLRNHKSNLSNREVKEKAIDMIRLVGIPSPEERYNQYPHEFSGGMRQRIMIAIALACEPKLLLADEPTTALDVTIQAQILELMKSIQDETGTAIVLITHDLGVVAETAHQVMVMYAGMIVEKGSVKDIFKNPSHPYTWGLMESIPDIKGEEMERLVPIEGSPPDLFSPPNGCPFAPRCKYAMEVCEQHIPPVYKVSEFHETRCWLQDERSPSIEELEEMGRKTD